MAAQDAQNGGCENGSPKVVKFTALKPQLFVEAPKGNDAVLFYKAAFGAEEVSRVMHPKRKAEQEQPLILSAELKLGSTVFLVSDLTEDSSAPVKGGLTTGVYCLETEDVDAAVANAVTAGAVADGEIVEGGEGACCGGRVGKVKDPYGNVWLICSPAMKCADVEA
nr:Glyoxalase-like domain protein [Ipomoea batatas]GMD73175.1 Glyoxalase-like domain protein [Ipomoea batatas]